MIERDFVRQKMREFQVEEFISSTLKGVGHSHTKIVKTPLGEKIIIFTSKPGLIVGRKGDNIARLTKALKARFQFENPQLEISEVQDINLDANIVAEKIGSSLERFGINRFKSIMHKAMEDVLNSGALGVEIILSGKVPSARARSWRVFGGYLKKSGDIAHTIVRKSKKTALLKSGIIGIRVSLMPPGQRLPDTVELLEEKQLGNVEEIKPTDKIDEGKLLEEIMDVSEKAGKDTDAIDEISEQVKPEKAKSEKPKRKSRTTKPAKKTETEVENEETGA